MSGMSAVALPRRFDRARIGLLGVGAALLLVAIAEPGARLPCFAAAAAITTAVFGWRIRQQNLRPRGMWLLLMLMTGLIAAAGTVRAVSNSTSTTSAGLAVGARLCAIAALLVLLTVTRNNLGRTRTWWTEWLLLLMAAAATTSQVLMMNMSRGDHLDAWLRIAPSSLPTDSLTVCLIVRMITTRRYLSRSIRTLLWGGAGLVAFDLAADSGDHRLASAGSAVLLVGLSAMVLLLLSVLDPSVARTLTGPAQHSIPTSSRRLLSMLPLVMTPTILWALGSLHVVPETSAAFLAVAQSALTLCALVLAIQSLLAVEDLAERDVLTGLTNRRGLPRMAEKVLASRSSHARASLAVVDLDDFKDVNDRHGHDIGDALLRAVAHRLCQAVGRNGGVCRVGGDEFVVVYLEDHADARPEVHTRNLALRISAALERPCEVGGLRIRASASIGVTPLNRTSDLIRVMVDSDTAMYAAKRAGRKSRAAAASVATHPRPSTYDNDLFGGDSDLPQTSSSHAGAPAGGEPRRVAVDGPTSAAS